MIRRNPAIWKRHSAVLRPTVEPIVEAPSPEAGVESVDAEAEFQQDYFGEHCIGNSDTADLTTLSERSDDEEAIVPGLI